ncbi:hypothetical protein ACHAWF_008292 [Thalassiosira exigua]
MGKALLDGDLVNGHMVNHLYKHLLGWSVMFKDLKDQGQMYFKSLNEAKDMRSNRTVVLIPNGSEVEVTKADLPKYAEVCLKYWLMGRCKVQLGELLLGFCGVLPERLLAISDFRELELLMCGLPEINMDI